MLKWIYVVNAVLSFCAFIYYFENTLSKVNQKQLLLMVFTAFASSSYAFLAFAQNLDSAILINVSCYIGSTLSMLMMMFVIFELCNYKVSRKLRLSLFVFDAVMIVLACTVRRTSLYYKAMELKSFLGAAYLSRDYGSLHLVFIIFVLSVNLASLTAVLLAFKNRKSVSIKTLTILLIILSICTGIYVLPRAIKVHIDLFPFAYTISDFLLIAVFRRSSMYDMSANLLNTFEQRNEYGYISFDLKKQFLGCSGFALKVFPELKNIRMDSKIPESEAFLTKEIINCLSDFEEGKHHEHIYVTDEYSVVCTITNIVSEKKKIGYLIELRDNTEQQRTTDLLKDFNSVLQQEVDRKTEKIVEIQDSIITGMASMVESRDNSTGGHIKRTSACVKVFIEALKLSPEYKELSDKFCSDMIKAAPMHDLGKIAVDDAVLRKPGKFEPWEYEQMKKHSAEGSRIVAEVLKNIEDEEFKTLAVNVAHYHHEKWNGSGYPAGLSEKNIPLEARIMAYADVFDALVSRRCYKEAFTYDRAFDIIKNDSGSHFDPSLTDIFIQCRPQLEKLYMGLAE